MWTVRARLLLTTTAILIAQLIRRCAGDPDAGRYGSGARLTSAYAGVLG